jgi:SAM-dependent methyltransferase
MIIWIKKITTFAANHLRYWQNRTGAKLNRLRKSQHQLTSTTEFDRYPELFQAVANNILSTAPIRILSFGCSTGEECFTLKRYFPHATILGVDINPSNLRKANTRNTDSSIIFKLSTPENISTPGSYDVIFCLSVLCRWEDTRDVENCGNIYPFQKFEETVIMLCDNLKSGGLLVIYNSNFRFEETSKAEGFQILRTPGIQDSGFVHKFDRHNNRVHQTHSACIFRKL